MTPRSRRFLLVVALLALGCRDNPLAPNTDVGLRVWAEVTPRSLSISDPNAALRIRVYVRNSTFREIRVVSGGPPYVFTGDPARSRGLWGSFRIACAASPLSCGPATDWWGDSVYVFPARTTVYNQADLTRREWSERGWDPQPGLYRVRAWFNGREGESATFEFLP